MPEVCDDSSICNCKLPLEVRCVMLVEEKAQHQKRSRIYKIRTKRMLRKLRTACPFQDEQEMSRIRTKRASQASHRLSFSRFPGLTGLYKSSSPMHQRGFGGPRGWFPITGNPPNIVSIVQILRLSSLANPAPVLASPWPAKTVSVRQKPNRVNRVNRVNPAHDLEDTKHIL